MSVMYVLPVLCLERESDCELIIWLQDGIFVPRIQVLSGCAGVADFADSLCTPGHQPTLRRKSTGIEVP